MKVVFDVEKFSMIGLESAKAFPSGTLFRTFYPRDENYTDTDVRFLGFAINVGSKNVHELAAKFGPIYNNHYRFIPLNKGERIILEQE